MNSETVKGLVVAAPASGSGKTTVTLGLLAALKRRGIDTAAFKIGPDFIDPGLHAKITGRPGRNLDGWMLERPVNLEIFARAAHGAEMTVVEGVMGLYDGFSGSSEAGSTAQMAKWLDLPVLLVVDAGSMARSFAALVKGFSEFDPDVKICGIVANNAASPGHMQYLKEAIQELPEIPLLGGIPRNAKASIPERHLGLFTAQDRVMTDERIDALASLVCQNIDLDRLIGSLDRVTVKQAPSPAPPEPLVRVAVAKDEAFCFYYEDNLDMLRENGCEIVFFSPLSDQKPPAGIHGLYLGGGYPELYGYALSKNTSMRRWVHKMCASGMPVYAECGGFMYLCRTLEDPEGNIFEMAGVYPFDTCMQNRLSSLSYREIRLAKNTPLGPAGSLIRGHEFHYSRIKNPDAEKNAIDVYDAADRTGAQRNASGWLAGRCLGSYVHLHFKSNPDTGGHFAAACAEFKAKGKNPRESL
ncbi:MAG: cobyrinate a,c-diamide synthase [Desulfobacteraceae bacterium]|nr:cobyrinate a,c-diamide synthase [Desulfobacteraceae bacterium]